MASLKVTMAEPGLRDVVILKDGKKLMDVSRITVELAASHYGGSEGAQIRIQRVLVEDRKFYETDTTYTLRNLVLAVEYPEDSEEGN